MSISNYLKLKDAVIKTQIYFVSSIVAGFIKRTKVFNDASVFGIKPGYSIFIFWNKSFLLAEFFEQ